jgi:hypothetical protein
VTVLLGTADMGFGLLVNGPEAVAQGANRYTRGINTFRMAEAVAQSRGWQLGWTLAEVPEVGHSEGAMYSSPQAVAAVQRALSRPRKTLTQTGSPEQVLLQRASIVQMTTDALSSPCGQQWGSRKSVQRG